MTDTTQGDTTPAKAKRKNVSEREFLKFENGVATVVDKMEDANGSRYVLLDSDGTLGGDKNIDQDFSVDSAFKTWNAVFGYPTKIGNIANTILNDKVEKGTCAEAYETIKDFLRMAASIDEATWTAKRGGGPRRDLPKLAAAVIEVILADGKTLKPGFTEASCLERLEKEEAYRAGVWQVPGVPAAYNRLMGKATMTVDSLMG